MKGEIKMKKILQKIVKVGMVGVMCYTLAFLFVHAFSFRVNQLESEEDMQKINQSIALNME